MSAKYDDLDFGRMEDRALYRQRVAREFELMSFQALRDEAARESGGFGFRSRLDATKAIADARIAGMAHDYMTETRGAALDCFGRP